MYRFLIVAAIALWAEKLCAEELPAIMLLQQGRTLSFVVADVTGVKRGTSENGDSAFIALSLTPSMSQRLRVFSSGLIGRQMMTISGGQVLTSDTKIRSAMSGPTLHIFGRDKQHMFLLADRLEKLRIDQGDGNKAFLVAAEQLAKVEVQSSDIKNVQYLDGEGTVIVGLPSDDTNAGSLLNDRSNWIAVIDGRVFEKLSAARKGDFLQLNISGNSSDQYSFLRKRFQSNVDGRK